MAHVVYANRTVLKSHPRSGSSIQLFEGQPWHSDSPVVKAHPDCFGPLPPQRLIMGLPDDYDHGAAIETATAAPGEKRNTKRRG